MTKMEETTRALWSAQNGPSFFAQAATGNQKQCVPKGEIDLLSQQTMLHGRIKAACDELRAELDFDCDISTCSARQRTFLWQISQPAMEGGQGSGAEVSVRSSIEQYCKFLHLMKVHGYQNHFYVPSYYIYLAWHTHMLCSTSRYMSETAELAGAYPHGVDNDGSVNQRTEDSKLSPAWADTKALWQQTFDTDTDLNGSDNHSQVLRSR